jgi:hypothetical protein
MQAFGIPRNQNLDFNSAQKDIFDGVQLIRGCNFVIRAKWDTLASGILAPLLKGGMYSETILLHHTPASDMRKNSVHRVWMGMSAERSSKYHTFRAPVLTL